MMNRARLTTTLLLCAACLLGAAVAGAQPPAKKLIEYGWDVPAPSYVAANIRQMEQRPFEGIIMRVPRIGSVFVNKRWEEEEVAAEFEALQKIEWDKFTDNFVIMYAASTMDWFSDEDWECVLHNASLVAKAARLGRCKGVTFDYEPYGDNPWKYGSQKHAETRTFEEYQAVARRRGAQFMEALQAEYPGLVFHTFFQLSYFSSIAVEPDEETRTRRLTDHYYGLLPAFINGMLDVAAPDVILTDGNESSYYYTDNLAFYRAFHNIRQTALGLVAQENRAKYLAQMQCAQALYVDQVFGLRTRPTLAQYMTPEERGQWFEHNVYYALATTDEYVWLYSEKMDWWKDRDLPPGLEEAVIRAKEKLAERKPLGFEMRDIVGRARERQEERLRETLGEATADILRLAAGDPRPVIDGGLDDPAWQRVSALSAFAPYAEMEEDSLGAQTLAWATWDRDNLYLAVRCEEPTVEALNIVGAARDDDVWMGESVDIFLATGAQPTPFYHIIINPRNVRWDAFQQSDLSADKSWDPDYESATVIAGDHWALEVAVPWSALGMPAPTAGTKLFANICRQRSSGGVTEHSSWSRCVSGFQEPGRFGVWVLR